jgi:hypothetical protein
VAHTQPCSRASYDKVHLLHSPTQWQHAAKQAKHTLHQSHAASVAAPSSKTLTRSILSWGTGQQTDTANDSINKKQ